MAEDVKIHKRINGFSPVPETFLRTSSFPRLLYKEPLTESVRGPVFRKVELNRRTKSWYKRNQSKPVKPQEVLKSSMFDLLRKIRCCCGHRCGGGERDAHT